MRSTIFSAVLLAAAVRAIQVTSPTKDQEVDLAAGFDVKWSTVSSDPKKAHLFLVNMAGGHTPYSKDLGEVDLTQGSVKVVVSGVPTDDTYQFNLQSIQEQNTGILAQSPQFEIAENDDDDDDDDTTTTTSASSTTSATSTTSSSISGVTLISPGSSTTVPTSAVTSAATTLATSTSATTGSVNGTSTTSSTTSASTGAAATQGASLLALAIGLVAVLA
ncbi:hypothetical protein B0T17DRAFT_501284 [Bombardia bombarda]|uniref:Yeast cell wall synthesis Kre9/Knh1-like N-terminal domain-containing protein n=1 Tax=Bombardia bombarda TaxID=252184 RepID=A0AA39U2H2_9PEZI|nr:hypothetical protein B0T17DRAFT_501284 [Bombardia bombarda]